MFVLAGSAQLSEQDRRDLEGRLKAREELLLPIYHQVAVQFADLHDTPGRMLEKGVVSVSTCSGGWGQLLRKDWYWGSGTPMQAQIPLLPNKTHPPGILLNPQDTQAASKARTPCACVQCSVRVSQVESAPMPCPGATSCRSLLARVPTPLPPAELRSRQSPAPEQAPLPAPCPS